MYFVCTDWLLFLLYRSYSRIAVVDALCTGWPSSRINTVYHSVESHCFLSFTWHVIFNIQLLLCHSSQTFEQVTDCCHLPHFRFTDDRYKNALKEQFGPRCSQPERVLLGSNHCTASPSNRLSDCFNSPSPNCSSMNKYGPSNGGLTPGRSPGMQQGGYGGPVPALGVGKSTIIVSALQTVAILSTVARLVHRRYVRKIWWDDFWAAVALLFDLGLFIMFVIYQAKTKHAKASKSLSNASRWTTLLTYTIALWTSRLTISVTITRITPKGRMRMLTIIVSFLFGVFMTAMLLQKIFICGTNFTQQWKCTIPKYTSYMELTTDNIADLWLILAPAYILWNTKLRPQHRRLIAAIFMCGFLTMLASIAHSIFIILSAPQWVGVSGEIQVTIAIMVSNLLVLVTAVYRAMRRQARIAGVSHLASPRRASSTSETRDVNTDTRQTSNEMPTTEYSHLTLTELTDSRITSTVRTHITLTELSESSRVESMQQSNVGKSTLSDTDSAGSGTPASVKR